MSLMSTLLLVVLVLPLPTPPVMVAGRSVRRVPRDGPPAGFLLEFHLSKELFPCLLVLSPGSLFNVLHSRLLVVRAQVLHLRLWN